jgi:hypothetical protein
MSISESHLIFYYYYPVSISSKHSNSKVVPQVLRPSRMEINKARGLLKHGSFGPLVVWFLHENSFEKYIL